MTPSKIVIAGASGFVGQALIERLVTVFPEAQIIALSRSSKRSHHPQVLWKQCDLFSEVSIAQSFPDRVDLAYYLVHSMAPTARLDQGSFADYDLIIADNFARACRQKAVQHLVYLGGLVPEQPELSLHLQSRLEVEAVFEEHQVPFTFFRAGLILGANGSSFQILTKLVRRLKVMICPAWTQTLTSPVDLPAVVEALVKAAKGASYFGKTYDLAGCRPLAYVQMMQLTAQQMGLRRIFIKVPFFSTTLSRLWVTLITGTSKHLVYPLIESLEHTMVARRTHSFYPDSEERTYLDLLRAIPKVNPARGVGAVPTPVRPTVRSVQRIPNPGQTAAQIAERYYGWLPTVTARLIKVQSQGDTIQLRFLNLITLIELHRVTSATESDRVTYEIKGGVLVQASPCARLEFRLVLDKKFVMVAIHDYLPALPWFLYRHTQAQLHRAVMWAFARHLAQG